LSTAGGPSAGICWSQGELPPEAVAGTHNYTPTNPFEPGCLVTDWLPPELVGIGMASDAGVVDPRAPIAVGKADAGPGTADAGPGTVVVPFTGVAPAGTLVAGNDRTFLVRNGGLLAWGDNTDGMLGDGTTLDRYHPVPVPALQSGVTAVSSFVTHSCALANGGVYCWGSNSHGELGNNDWGLSTVPVPVVGLSTGATSVAVGWNHSCAVVNGGVKCWGSEMFGVLGNGETADSYVPVPVTGLSTGATAVVAGLDHACALVNGGVRCWGRNDENQAGDNTANGMRRTPVAVVGLESGVTQIAAGGQHTCAIVQGGLRCWGSNIHGELGNGETTTTTTPTLEVVQVKGLAAPVLQVAGGFSVTCVILESGAALCWGYNDYYQIGNPLLAPYAYTVTPYQIPQLAGGVSAISVGGHHSCAMVGSAVKCWGENNHGERGVDALFVVAKTPVDVKFQ
jgi:alpha-tubulin suppressor-like RCC1 family protein